MKSAVKKIFTNLLEINNTSKNQEFIFNFWKKLKNDSNEISDMIPLVINNNPGIHQKIKEFHTIEIDCNKIGKNFKEKPIHPFNYSKKIINRFSGLFPDSIIMKNEEVSAKLSTCLDYFMHKIHQDKSWYVPEEVDKIIDINWNSIILSEKLEKNLDNKKNVKQTKI